MSSSLAPLSRRALTTSLILKDASRILFAPFVVCIVLWTEGSTVASVLGDLKRISSIEEEIISYCIQ